MFNSHRGNTKYDNLNRLNKVTDSHGNASNYLYDAVGRLNGIWAPNYGTVSFRMDPGGRRVEKLLPNGVSTRYSYNADSTLSQVVNRSTSTTIISQHDYLYDGFGNRRQATDRINGISQTNTYTYDSLDRLLTAKNGTVALDEAYSYDPVGNLTQQTVGTPVATTNAYVYDAANQMLETRNGTTIGPLLAAANVFDANGSLIKRCVGEVLNANVDCIGAENRNLLYDSLNRQILAEPRLPEGRHIETYAYDHEGRRISKRHSTESPPTTCTKAKTSTLSTAPTSRRQAPSISTARPRIHRSSVLPAPWARMPRCNIIIRMALAV